MSVSALAGVAWTGPMESSPTLAAPGVPVGQAAGVGPAVGPDVAVGPVLDGPLRAALDLVATAGDDPGAVPAVRVLLESLPGGARDSTDRVRALAQIYRAMLGPLVTPAELARSRCVGHPVLTRLKYRLEQEWLGELGDRDGGPRSTVDTADPAVVAAELRRLAATDRLPRVYRWLASTADADQLRRFLALEGGPDADFDDLVADCQVGLVGPAKMELARNYWDELGQGNPDDVHTTVHEQLVDALGITSPPAQEQTVQGLERSAFTGLLATNHHLQPQMIGALGMTELQAGPRCRLVLQAFDRIGVPAEAYAFYAVHADVDPRHGADWVDHAVVPLVTERPHWGALILQGARWRWQLNDRFFSTTEQHLCPSPGTNTANTDTTANAGPSRPAAQAPAA